MEKPLPMQSMPNGEWEEELGNSQDGPALHSRRCQRPISPDISKAFIAPYPRFGGQEAPDFSPNINFCPISCKPRQKAINWVEPPIGWWKLEADQAICIPVVGDGSGNCIY